MGRVGKTQNPGQTDLSPNEDTLLLASGLGLMHHHSEPSFSTRERGVLTST